MRFPLPKRVLGFLFIGMLYALSAIDADATVRRVPADHPTIQQAINASVDGDTVLVAPGTYTENINFLGKAIQVSSEGGPLVTIIDGSNVNSVVKFVSGEGPTSVLSGFTLRNGFGIVDSDSTIDGGGIRIVNSSPTIENNIVTHNRSEFEGGGIVVGGQVALPLIKNNIISDNTACSGPGIAIHGSSPHVQGNQIINNTSSGCSGGLGGGILIEGFGSAEILNNTISDNVANTDGGGIALNIAGTPTIRNNTISRNRAIDGGGISMFNFSEAEIIQNIITDNFAFSSGGGIYWLVPLGTRGPRLVNNTIAGNDSPTGSGILADGFDAQTEVVNNIIIAKEGQVAFFCGNFNDVNPPIVHFNDVFSPQGLAYGGACSDKTGMDGNISADPLFVNPATGDYHLKQGSPAIDVGLNAAPNLPATDLDGSARIKDGNGDGVAIVDMGVYEAPPTRPFNFCIQDDSSGNILQINTTTGEYEFTNCAGLTVSGTGTLTRRGSLITLQHNAADRRVSATIDASTNKATASIQLLSLGRTFSIIDRNLTNNTCTCR